MLFNLRQSKVNRSTLIRAEESSLLIGLLDRLMHWHSLPCLFLAFTTKVLVCLIATSETHTGFADGALASLAIGRVIRHLFAIRAFEL
jgi:hypothetical protein